ncbi:efflux RND transporter permease subunit [Gemmata sp. JC673]|uniref:Efflux RND transporter permease subunit n=1 Tax=Gemmata algarum TaxID=2975278 RepID=A0ABU5EZZ0_9BACT|nr:efflux RND transporter permease subunit [Gemmata algarum]MDY3560524.1 efflux RND transporter permease subunit [Gemmata algarum]
MISNFFIDRPIFANVLAIITLLFGAVALYRLPVERYPPITPPTVVVSGLYPGANAKVVTETVAAPIEQEVNGVENMMYMSSTSSADGSYSLTITFEIGTDLDAAQVLVQNRLSIAEPRLPEEVRRQGLQVRKQSSAIILAISLTAPPPKDRYDLTLDPNSLRATGAAPEHVLEAVRAAGARVEPHLSHVTEIAAGVIAAGSTGAAPATEHPLYYRIAVADDFANDGPAGADKFRALTVRPPGRPPMPLTDVARVDTLPDPYDGLFLSNYATLKLRDELSRVTGVGDVLVRGVGAYSMRVWLNPDKLAARQLTTEDVLAALQRQNVQVAAGQVGQPPNPSGQRFQYTVTTLGRLQDPEQFKNIIVKSGAAGQIVYLREIADVELGGQSYDSFASRSAFPAANILIYQLPGSNALNVAKGVRAAMEKVKPTLPPGVEYSIPFDTTKFVEAAIDEVYTTLFEAGVLVLVVILVFLQSWRALFVPATTVPITIIGAFAFMPFLGFSVNLLTLFGLILAIGIVVDDAIVIVENASHHIEKGMTPRAATIQAMSEVTGPIISITFVLIAVFLPTAFLGGITGQLYKQFALTIAATAVISAVNALTLKPAQCAVWLKPVKKKGLFSRAFDAVYGPIEGAYAWSVKWLLRAWPVALVAFLALAVGTGMWYQQTPQGFLPDEDQGYIVIAVQLPDAASIDRTREVTDRMNTALRNTPGVENWFVLGGFSLLDGTAAPNSATAFAAWKDWKHRKDPALSQEALVARLQREFGVYRDAMILVLVPPSIQGLGFVGGFQIQIEDREGVGTDVLQERANAVVAAAAQRPEIEGRQTRSTFRAGVPQIYLDIDREKAEKMGVKVDDVFSTLQANLGSVYVNDFNKFGRTYQVRIQADARFRGDTDIIKRLEVPGREGGVNPDGSARTGPRPRVPLGTLLAADVVIGPQSIIRYNLYPTAQIPGRAKEGISSGEAIAAMEEVANKELPPTMGFEWTALSYQEKRSSGSAFDLLGKPITESFIVFGLAVLMVYLVLAALYESWLLPFAVILVVPLGLLGVVAAVNTKAWLHDKYPSIASMDNNIYTQIGVVLIIALASKNAILIVEFARELRLGGRSVRQAALEAARMRFRPIIMTSFAFILGVVPLVLATGAGAASRQSLGTAVFGGMITSTVLAVFFVPVFYVAIQGFIELMNGPPKPSPGEEPAVAAGHHSHQPAAEPVAEVPATPPTEVPHEDRSPPDDPAAPPVGPVAPEPDTPGPADSVQKHP